MRENLMRECDNGMINLRYFRTISLIAHLAFGDVSVFTFSSRS